jgi:hypothetical protein
MIYLRYVYAKSSLPEPSTVALFVEDNDWVKNEVTSEFAAVFPNSYVVLDLGEHTSQSSDLMVLVYRETTHELKDLLEWGRYWLPEVRLALGFYCVDRRRFDVVVPQEFGRWERRQQVLTRTARWLRQYPTLLNVCQIGLSRCAF